jgi:hypothetical protein
MSAEEKQELIREIIECVKASTMEIAVPMDEDDYTPITYSVIDPDSFIQKLLELI